MSIGIYDAGRAGIIEKEAFDKQTLALLKTPTDDLILTNYNIKQVDFSKIHKLQYALSLANNDIRFIDLTYVLLINSLFDVSNNDLRELVFASCAFGQYAKLVISDNPNLRIINFGNVKEIPYLEMSGSMLQAQFIGNKQTSILVLHITDATSTGLAEYYHDVKIDFATKTMHGKEGRRRFTI